MPRAAAYLEAMPARERADFDDHLLACEACWREVALARAGRALAESIQHRAPAQLRESIRAGIAAAAAGREPGTGRRHLARALAAAAVVAVVIVGLAVWRPWPHPGRHTAVPGLPWPRRWPGSARTACRERQSPPSAPPT
jgi:hypothetical protein